MRIWTRARAAFLLGFLVGAVALVVMQAYVISRANERVRRGFDACRGRICGIYTALHSYARDHDGFFPPSLEVLVEEGYLAPRELSCPVSGKPYVYTLNGLTVKEDQVPWHYLLLIEQGFPHDYISALDPRKARPRKLFWMGVSGWRYDLMEDWATALEEDPAAMTKVFGLDTLPTELLGSADKEDPSLLDDTIQPSDTEKTRWPEKESE